MNNKKVILSAILTIAMCVSIIAGATTALFTSESRNDIAITSGKVNVQASVVVDSLYSPALVGIDGNVIDSADAAGDTFANGGFVETVGSSVNLHKLTPGDKAILEVKITNSSTVDFLQRITLSCLESDKELFSELLVGISDTADGEYKYYSNFATEWVPTAPVAVDGVSEDSYKYISIELPTFSGNEWQDKSCTLSLNVNAVQGNASVAGTAVADRIFVANNQTELEECIAEAADGQSILLNGAKWASADVVYADDKEITLVGTAIGTLTVNAPAGTVNLYNKTDVVIGEVVAHSSLHIFGEVGEIVANSGRFVIEEPAVVDTINVAATDDVRIVLANNATVYTINCESAAADSAIKVEIPVGNAVDVNVDSAIGENVELVEYNKRAETAEDFVAEARNLKVNEILALRASVVNELDASEGILALIKVQNATLDFGNNFYTLATAEGNVNWMGLYLNGGTATLNGLNGGIDASKNAGDYAIHVKSTNDGTVANLTINGGTYIGGTTAVNVQSGKVTINGGFFQVAGDATYLLNCYDSAYKNGTAEIAVYGGTFVNFDPSNNAAEGAGTSFVAPGYKVDAATQSNGDVWYTVSRDEDVILINNTSEFLAFAANVNKTNTYAGKTVALLSDVDLSGIQWSPINYFAGIFDGMGHTVSNLSILNGAGGHNGLFGYVNQGGEWNPLPVIKNFTVNNVEIAGNGHWTAAVVGEAFCADVENVTVSGNISINGGSYTGAIVGNGYANVKNCHVIGNDGSEINSSSSYLGAVIGWRGEGASYTVDSCTVANVSLSGSSILGGIAGISQTGNKINNCTLTDVTLNYAGYPSEDASGIGAISGWSLNNVSITNCSFSGTIATNATLYNDKVTGKGYNGAEQSGLVLTNNKINATVERSAGTAQDLILMLNEMAETAGSKVINITNDIDVAGEWDTFVPEVVSGSYDVIINGNGHTISNLNTPLLRGSFGGSGVLKFENLTIKSATISHATGHNGLGIGAFVAYSDAAGGVVFENCHLVDSSVTCGGAAGYAGGFIGNSSTPVSFVDCSVSGSTIQGANSTGAFIGQAQNMLSVTNAEIVDTDVKIDNYNPTDDWRVGMIVGTVNLANATYEFTNVTVDSLSTVSMTASATLPVGQSNLWGRVKNGAVVVIK